MTIPSLYSSSPFYNSTSALNGSPFCPMGIGYANRIEGLSDYPIDGVGDSIDWGEFANKVTDLAIKIGKPIVENAALTAQRKLQRQTNELAGDKYGDVVAVFVNGKQEIGTKVTSANGQFVEFLDGTRILWTPTLQQTAVTAEKGNWLADPKNQTMVVLGVLALVAVYFISKRK